MNWHDLVDRQMRQNELLVSLKKEMKVTYQKKKKDMKVFPQKKRWRNTGAVKNSWGMIGTILLSGQRSIAKVNP